MDHTREPRSMAAEPAPSDVLSDDAVVAYLRARAPGLPAARFDARAIAARARVAVRRRRWLRNGAVAAAGATTVYLALAVVGPVPVPGLGTVGVPGGDDLRAVVGGLLPGAPPEPEEWPGDVDRLEAEVVPVLERLDVSYYLFEPGQCRILEYRRGRYGDQEGCGELTPLDARAVVDFEELTGAVERSGVAVERIRRDASGISIPLQDGSWQYNWSYEYRVGGGSPPPPVWPEDEWTHIRGDWWFHRTHDD